MMLKTVLDIRAKRSSRNILEPPSTTVTIADYECLSASLFPNPTNSTRGSIASEKWAKCSDDVVKVLKELTRVSS
jgi:hypothetical protein